MLELQLGSRIQTPREFLFIGAHCDDIEIGCGGVVSRLTREYPKAKFQWVVFSSNKKRATEAKRSADLFLGSDVERSVLIKNFRNGYFPYIGGAIKDSFEELKTEVNPDIIFTHYGEDLHQDHRTLSELTWNTFRNHLILEYEIPKYDGGLGSPNFFFTLKDIDYNKKVKIILESFMSEGEKPWFSRDTFLALMRLRGIECNSASGYAEAFYCRKAVV